MHFEKMFLSYRLQELKHRDVRCIPNVQMTEGRFRPTQDCTDGVISASLASRNTLCRSTLLWSRQLPQNQAITHAVGQKS
jgi:hypothetical protein